MKEKVDTLNANLNKAKQAKNDKNFTLAIEKYRDVLNDENKNVQALMGLGEIAYLLNNSRKAIHYIKQALSIDPWQIDALYYLGLLALESEHFQRADDLFSQALLIDDEHAPSLVKSGYLKELKGEINEAIQLYQKVIELDDSHEEALFRMGLICFDINMLDYAIHYFQSVLNCNRNHYESFNFLGQLCQLRMELETASICCSNSMIINPMYKSAYFHLANIYFQQGHHQEAIKFYKRLLRLYRLEKETPVEVLSLIYSRLLRSKKIHSLSRKDVFKAYKSWGYKFTKSSKKTAKNYQHSKIKLAYILPENVTISFQEIVKSLTRYHSRGEFEIYLYFDQKSHLSWQSNLYSYVQECHFVQNMSDEEVAELISEKEIDICVDLMGHENPRLNIFNSRPAPLQISGIISEDATGLESIDYLILPEDSFLIKYQEELLESVLITQVPFYFNRTFYHATSRVKGAKYPSFGSHCPLYLINSELIQTWAQILKAVPDSRFYLSTPEFVDLETRDSYINFFEKSGVNREQLIFEPNDGVQFYNPLNLFLPPFPESHPQEILKAINNNIPVMMLEDCYGSYLLKYLNLEEFLAQTKEAYLTKVIDYLKHVQSNKVSPSNDFCKDFNSSLLMDPEAFTRAIEECYKTAFKKKNATIQ